MFLVKLNFNLKSKHIALIKEYFDYKSENTIGRKNSNRETNNKAENANVGVSYKENKEGEIKSMNTKRNTLVLYNNSLIIEEAKSNRMDSASYNLDSIMDKDDNLEDFTKKDFETSKNKTGVEDKKDFSLFKMDNPNFVKLKSEIVYTDNNENQGASINNNKNHVKNSFISHSNCNNESNANKFGHNTNTFEDIKSHGKSSFRDNKPESSNLEVKLESDKTVLDNRNLEPYKRQTAPVKIIKNPITKMSNSNPQSFSNKDADNNTQVESRPQIKINNNQPGNSSKTNTKKDKNLLNQDLINTAKANQISFSFKISFIFTFLQVVEAMIINFFILSLYSLLKQWNVNVNLLFYSMAYGIISIVLSLIDYLNRQRIIKRENTASKEKSKGFLKMNIIITVISSTAFFMSYNSAFTLNSNQKLIFLILHFILYLITIFFLSSCLLSYTITIHRINNQPFKESINNYQTHLSAPSKAVATFVIICLYGIIISLQDFEFILLLISVCVLILLIFSFKFVTLI